MQNADLALRFGRPSAGATYFYMMLFGPDMLANYVDTLRPKYLMYGYLDPLGFRSFLGPPKSQRACRTSFLDPRQAGTSGASGVRLQNFASMTASKCMSSQHGLRLRMLVLLLLQ